MRQLLETALEGDSSSTHGSWASPTTATAKSTKRPERTFPSFVAKSVPGEKEPLHRLVDTEKNEKQRANSIKECKKIWGDYSGTRLQCDEYAFASTHEGSLKGNNRFSVRLIEGTDNEAGGRLNSMYTANRILDGDPFYVKITP
ncbi:NucA/NucB deoxyribonuclease domain-containing protein [Streptomyces peucetius]|nr:hypothetical protein CGZ69_34835 [Streptomyces peucetius subsp. caesius ATCC 27952]